MSVQVRGVLVDVKLEKSHLLIAQSPAAWGSLCDVRTVITHHCFGAVSRPRPARSPASAE